VLRVVVEVGEEMRGELVDPLSEQRRRFTGLESLVDAVRAWIDDAQQCPRQHTITRAEDWPADS
jgi:hypothetical protein